MAEDGEEAQRAAIEGKLLEEADRVVTRLEAALAAAPDDPELRAQLERIVAQARELRSRIAAAISEARCERDRTGHA
jgi:hypothetical protein